MGQDKTLEFVSGRFFCPEIEVDINDLMRSCLMYQGMKYPRHA
jgi:hypothetical protein